ncbi:MAG: hypothetical protein M1812_002967 [Candelaria pacifica]|nr:MAG: hypothetical protein M1812_002967 [Candelaria pacifica]
MVKSYLKYEHSNTFGLINSATSNIIWTPDDSSTRVSTRNTGAGRAVVAANEEVLCWDVKKGELLSRWQDNDCKAEVTAIAQSKALPDLFAVGYDDGSIRLWDSQTPKLIISFNGHRSAITTLAFDKSGDRLASGAKDTNIILWDLVAEVRLFTLRGHKDQITALHFLQPSSEQPVEEAGHEVNGNGMVTNGLSDVESGEGFLLTTSKDALIKIWDIASQHCIETHVAQTNGECWAMGVSPDGSGCITAGNDGELKIWAIDPAGLRRVASRIEETIGKNHLTERGVMYRQGKDRTLSIMFHPKADYVAIHGSEKAVELWRIRSPVEVQKSLARKRKRRREKAVSTDQKEQDEDNKMVDNEEINQEISSAEISDVFVSYVIVRTGGKVRSIDWAGGRASKALQLLTATTNNQLEVYSIPTREKGKKTKSDEPPDYNRTFAVEMPGHRTDIRAIALSSDDRMLASTSSGSLKIWNVVVGTKSGSLELFDIASSSQLDTVSAHSGAIWTLQVHPDGKSVATGSADKTAKFWTFTIMQEEIPGTKRTTPRLKLIQTRTLKVTDDILSLRFSPDSRLLALALLDNTIKVFFTDSLKLFLNLYGHKLPVLNMSISFDSKMLVSCAADKNIRLWGLDFGDCHKAIFAHNDSIMQVSFIPHNASGDGHHFFSASKDATIKYWDGTKFSLIQRLDGHKGEIWAMTISQTGSFLATASHDKSIRIWTQTDEQIFLEEERERELEDLYEKTLSTTLSQNAADDDDINNQDPDNPMTESTTAPGKQTIETLTAGEKIAGALELGLADYHLMQEYSVQKLAHPNTALAPPARHPIFLAFNSISAESHVLAVLQRTKAAQLTDALLVLPFSILPSLFTFLSIFAQKGWNIPLTCRILFFMLKTHHRQIVASKGLRATLDGLRGNLRSVLQDTKDQMGFNLAALSFLTERVRENEVSGVVDVEKWDMEERKGKGGKKRGFVNIT